MPEWKRDWQFERCCETELHKEDQKDLMAWGHYLSLSQDWRAEKGEQGCYPARWRNRQFSNCCQVTAAAKEMAWNEEFPYCRRQENGEREREQNRLDSPDLAVELKCVSANQAVCLSFET